jgi:serine/alanine adding enzyme
MLKEVIYATDESPGWSSALPVQESVFGSVDFASIVEEHLGYRARLYVLQNRECRIAYPFFCRPIGSLPLDEEVKGRLWDTVSPEFTGPFGWGGSVHDVAADFPKMFSSFAVSQGVVAEFIRLHPWKAVLAALLEDCVHYNREIVYVDLTRPEDELWQHSFTHACRKNIMRSQRENVRVFEARTMDDIREFHRLYILTMEERKALKDYYFSLAYFAAIFERLKANARFVLAEYRDRLVAGMLYLHDRDDVYSYLGGADYTFQQVRPTNAVIYDTILWGKRQGKKRLVLGGGYSPDDSILRFKASFSPARARFHVYKRVHLPERYEALCRSWSRVYQRDPQTSTYFPPYRSSPTAQSVGLRMLLPLELPISRAAQQPCDGGKREL